WLAVLALAPLLAVGGYLLLGTPAALDPAARAAARMASTAPADGSVDPAKFTEAVTALRAELERNPQQPEGWALLARSLSVQGDAAGARGAYAKALELVPDEPALMVEFAQASARAHPQNLFEDQSLALLQRAATQQPSNQRASWSPTSRRCWASSRRPVPGPIRRICSKTRRSPCCSAPQRCSRQTSARAGSSALPSASAAWTRKRSRPGKRCWTRSTPPPPPACARRSEMRARQRACQRQPDPPPHPWPRHRSQALPAKAPKRELRAACAYAFRWPPASPNGWAARASCSSWRVTPTAPRCRWPRSATPCPHCRWT